MRIVWVQLVEFRNYRALSYTPSSKLNLLTGANARGKTNLLEALGVLLTGRSFRTSRLAEIPAWGAPAATVVGELQFGETARIVRKTIRRLDSGAWHGAGEECPWARAVAFGWRDLEVLTGSPAARRNLVDGFAARLYPGHRPALLRYRQVLARRNHLLRQGLPQGLLDARLAPWDEQLAAIGMELVARRRRAVAALQMEIARIHPALAGTGQKVHLAYQADLGEATEASALRTALERRRGDEARRGQTLVGPHRDDLAIEVDGVDVRVFGSRGQQRLLALALRLAEVLPIREAVGTAPVLLLDDALSELDGTTRDNVLREVATAEQVFLTTAEPLTVAGAARWAIREGGIFAA